MGQRRDVGCCNMAYACLRPSTSLSVELTNFRAMARSRHTFVFKLVISGIGSYATEACVWSVQSHGCPAIVDVLLLYFSE